MYVCDQLAFAQSVSLGLYVRTYSKLSWKVRDEPKAMEVIQGDHNCMTWVAMKRTALQVVVAVC